MFDNNVFIKGSCHKVKENNETIGFELATNITYYRGIPLSMLEYIHVYVNDKEVSQESIRISLEKKDWFTLKEAETVTTYKWEYGDPLYIRVLQDGGLPKGEQKVKLIIATRTAYIPVPLEGVREETVTIA